MAVYNSVPLGQSGTGAAFTLGESKAANQFISDQSKAQQLAYAQRVADQERVQNDAKLFQQNALKLKGGLLWQDDINKLSQEHINEGIGLMQNKINPFNIDYNNPDAVKKGSDYQIKRQGVIAKNDARNVLQTSALKTIDAIQKEPELYEPEDIKSYNQWLALPLDKAIETPPPPVRTKFNPLKELVPKLDAVTLQTSKVVGNTRFDEKKMLVEPTRQNVETLIGSDERAKRWIKQSTGLTPSEGANIPSTFAEARKDLMKQYDGNPSLRESIAKQYGITAKGPELDALLNQEAQSNVAKKLAYNSVIDQYTQVAKAKADEFIKTNPDYTYEKMQMARDRMDMAKRRESGAVGAGVPQEKQFKTDETTIGDKILPPQNTIKAQHFVTTNPVPIGLPQTQRIFDVGSGKTIDISPTTSLEIVGMGYVPLKDGTMELNVNMTDSKGRNLLMAEDIVPTKTKADKNYIAAKKAVVESYNKSKNAKPNSAPKTTISKKDVATRASAAGYSVAEYTKLLKERGIKIQ